MHTHQEGPHWIRGSYRHSGWLNEGAATEVFPLSQSRPGVDSDWVKLLSKKSSASIRWNCYWWKCPPPLLRSPGSDHIFIIGLRRATFYKANRLLRQFQYEQGMPNGKRRRPFTPVDTNPTSISGLRDG